jgi:hypothetical protein
MNRICIYPKDAAAITGQGYEAGKRLLQRIRTHLGKPSRALISIQEFCAYTHLPEAEVSAAINRGAARLGP